MPPSSSGAARSASVEALLRDLGPRVRRAEAPREAPRRWPTGFDPLDRMLCGGFPEGRIGEVSGPASSGRTSLALSLLAATTGCGEHVAVVDAADAFDPASAAGAGVALERTLWVRPPEPARAWRAAEIVLRAGGFALVELDLSASEGRPRLPGTARWLRLARAAAATRTTLVVLTSERRLAGAHADLALELRSLRPRFGGMPLLLEGAETEAALVRHRGGPEGTVRLCLRSAPA